MKHAATIPELTKAVRLLSEAVNYLASTHMRSPEEAAREAIKRAVRAQIVLDRAGVDAAKEISAELDAELDAEELAEDDGGGDA